MISRFKEAQTQVGLTHNVIEPFWKQVQSDLPKLIEAKAKAQGTSVDFCMKLELEGLGLYRSGMARGEMTRLLAEYHSKMILDNRQTVYEASMDGKHDKVVCVTRFDSPSPTSLSLSEDDSLVIIGGQLHARPDRELQETILSELQKSGNNPSTTPVIKTDKNSGVTNVDMVPNNRVARLRVLDSHFKPIKGIVTPEVVTVKAKVENGVARLDGVERTRLCLVDVSSLIIYEKSGHVKDRNQDGNLNALGKSLGNQVVFSGVTGYSEVWEPQHNTLAQMPFLREIKL